MWQVSKYSWVASLLNALLLASFLFLIASCSSAEDKVRIKEVVDGDTVILDTRYENRLRYIGIDAPEMLTIDSPGDPFSLEAKKLNESLVKGKDIRIEFDSERYDDYGRLLGYVFVNDIFVNEKLLREGLAMLFVLKSNTKYLDILKRAQQEAKRKKRGIWGDLSSFRYPKENQRFRIKPASARRFLDRRVVVVGKITEVRENRAVIKLTVESDLDVVIFKNNIDNFTHFGIDPETHYLGSIVQVIGKIKMYRGRPEIIVPHPMYIRKAM